MVLFISIATTYRDAQTFRSAMSMKFGPESQTHRVCAPAPEAMPTVTQAFVVLGRRAPANATKATFVNKTTSNY